MRLSILGTALSAVVAVTSVAVVVGHTARWVDVIGLFFGGVGMGAGVAATAMSVRMARRNAV